MKITIHKKIWAFIGLFPFMWKVSNDIVDRPVEDFDAACERVMKEMQKTWPNYE